MTPPDPTHAEPSARPRPGQLTAMISSTALDLPEHRELVYQACLDAGIHPIGMEHLPARDATGVAVSLEMVQQADIYIGIYAFRYGWVPEGRDVSITEMEFDRAVERKTAGKLREILVFTAHREHAFTADDIEADRLAQEKLRKFKERAADGRVRREFKSAEELHRLVFQALSEFKGRQPYAAPRTDIPHNLPRLQPFFGREDELAHIREALDPENRTWGALIDGPGGMGKTSLAVRAALDCTPAQFDRIVFVSVKNRELDDTGLRQVGDFLIPGFLELLNELARELGQPDITKAPEDQRVRLLHEALRGQRVLLILDNLESLPKPDRDRLFTFVKRLPQGCKAILTTREPFGNVGDGFKLDPLTQDAALAMLAELSEHSKQLAKTTEAKRIALYEQANGNPLLIRWVAGQLGRGRCLTFDDALDFLRSAPQGNDALEFVFGDMVNDFSEDETKVLCALTHFALPAKVEHIAPVVDCNEGTTEDALSSLTNRSLVVPNIKETAFALVPMVADFLRRRKPEVVAETGDRLEKRAYVLIVENGYQKHDNFPILDAAWPTIAAALPRFLVGPNNQLQTVCDSLTEFLDFTGRWDERLTLWRDAEVKAEAAKDFFNAGWRAYEGGWVHYLRRQSAEVLACADRAESHWREAKASTRELVTAVYLRGIGHSLAGDYLAAIAAYREALEFLRTLSSESRDVATILNALANAEHGSGDLDAAGSDYREALRIAQVTNQHETVAICTTSLVSLALDRQDWPGAEALAREALSLSEKVGRQELIAYDCYCLAKSLARQDQKAKALPHARRAVEIFTTLRSTYLEAARRILAECES